MKLEEPLCSRSGSRCELCGSADGVQLYEKLAWTKATGDHEADASVDLHNYPVNISFVSWQQSENFVN